MSNLVEKKSEEWEQKLVWLTYIIKKGEHCQPVWFISGFSEALVLVRVIMDNMKLKDKVEMQRLGSQNAPNDLKNYPSILKQFHVNPAQIIKTIIIQRVNKYTSIVFYDSSYMCIIGVNIVHILYNSAFYSQPLPCSGCRQWCAPPHWPPGPSRPSAGASGQPCTFLGGPLWSPYWVAGQFELMETHKCSDIVFTVWKSPSIRCASSLYCRIYDWC